MTPIDTKALVTGRVWQAIAQSGVDLSLLSREQQEQLVHVLTESMLVTIDEILDTVDRPPTPSPMAAPTAGVAARDDDEEERILWEGRPFLSLVERYIITTERVRIQTGLLSNAFDDLELIRIQDIDFSQHLTERMLNIGDLLIHSANASQREVMLRNIKDPSQVHEILRRAMINARKRYGLAFREEM
jgi:hypothetical protein